MDETYEVGLGPTSLALGGDDVYVARTFYDGGRFTAQVKYLVMTF